MVFAFPYDDTIALEKDPRTMLSAIQVSNPEFFVTKFSPLGAGNNGFTLRDNLSSP